MHRYYDDVMKELGEMNKMGKEVIIPFDKTEEYYIELNNFERKIAYDTLKRCFDIIFSMLALLILIIPMCIIAIAIKCTSEGAVLYTHDRLGKNGKPFKIIKFRTMIDDAEKDCIQWSGKDDPRVTRLGAYLRRYHIDELPQLRNIFIGDMSFVGPRPERECYYDAFETYIHGFSERLKVKPGLTGIAQLCGGSLMRPEEKIVYDVEYINKRSIWLDFKVLVNTVKTVVSGRYRNI